MKPQISFRATQSEDIPWFRQTTNYRVSPDWTGIVAYCEGTERMGMVLFDGWTPNAAMAHFSIPRPRCLIPLWNEAVGYLRQNGKVAVFGVTPSDNARALRAIRRLGWTEQTRLKDGWSEGVDLVISEYRIVKVST